MRCGSGWRRLATLLTLAWALLAQPGHAEEPLASQVRIEGERVWVEVSFTVQASRAEVWAVLTDFEHMARFISNVVVSKVVARHGPVLQVYQRGSAHRGPLDFPFEVLREVHLDPMHRIESHLISGSMKKQDGVTELTDEGGGTRVDYHGESAPGVWIPPVVGKPFIEAEIREQFLEIETEILRRHGPSSASQAPAE
jgi:carbon monoxide dehydrogenase subunit G